MTKPKLNLFSIVLTVGVAATAAAAEKDVLGWEGARWGMTEDSLRKAFASKRLVPVPPGEGGERAWTFHGYVFLGCPFDAIFHLAPSRGLVRIDLTQVEKLSGHTENIEGEHQKACDLVEGRLVDKFGPADQRRYEKAWRFPSGEVTTGGAQMGQVYITFISAPIASKK